jgi:hypothetical protein
LVAPNCTVTARLNGAPPSVVNASSSEASSDEKSNSCVLCYSNMFFSLLAKGEFLTEYLCLHLTEVTKRRLALLGAGALSTVLLNSRSAYAEGMVIQLLFGFVSSASSIPSLRQPIGFCEPTLTGAVPRLQRYRRTTALTSMQTTDIRTSTHLIGG